MRCQCVGANVSLTLREAGIDENLRKHTHGKVSPRNRLPVRITKNLIVAARRPRPQRQWRE